MDLKFDQLRHVHIVGVGGTLMGAFAAFLKRRGVRVTGSDMTIYPPMSDVLKNAGVELWLGYQAENLKKIGGTPDLVVIGNVISKSNPECEAVIQQGLPFTSLPEAMKKLMLVNTTNIVVSGTHGKTTTSSMMSHVLKQAGRDPNYFIGGVSADLPESFYVSQLEAGKFFVLEGDEYDTAYWDKVPKFNHYLPNHVLLTSVEFDHADIYRDLEHVQDAFRGLMARIRPSGHLIACVDDVALREVIKSYSGKIIRYGRDFKNGAEFSPQNVQTSESETRFELLDQNQKRVAQISIQLPGLHNALNATAVYLEALQAGLTSAEAIEGLKSFRGVKRRQEVRGEKRGVIVIDDFAHHPTAVRETLRALKQKYSGRRLIAVFEPRSATSRRKVFQNDFAAAFAEARHVFVAKPYDLSKIASEDQFSSDELVNDISKLGSPSFLMKTVEEGVGQVAQFAQSGDLIAVLSNGGFDGFIDKLLKALER